jgi:hypothetical protein
LLLLGCLLRQSQLLYDTHKYELPVTATELNNLGPFMEMMVCVWVVFPCPVYDLPCDSQYVTDAPTKPDPKF